MTPTPDRVKTPAAHSHQDNILIDACGPALERVEIGKRLTHLPPSPGHDAEVPLHQMDHLVADVFRLHIPTSAGIDLAQTIRFMLVEGYVHRNPSSPATWQRIYSGIGAQAGISPIQLGATVTGISGAGKSTAIERALQLHPQVVFHEKMPGFAKPSPQLLWLKIDVPASGKIADLARNLARATDAALGTSYAEELLHGRKLGGEALAHRWLQKISCNFLGLLVLDEVQNLFKIQTKAVRSARSRSGSSQRPELRIVDDEALKFLLTLSNSAKIPTLYCATPDGMSALSTRMSTMQRMLTGGFHTIAHARTADDEFFRKWLFPSLCRYQWLPNKLAASDELRRLLFNLSAGIPRVAMMVWFHATRRAVQRRADGLAFGDLQHAGDHALAPLRPALDALLRDDPRRLQRYEDLLSGIQE